MRQPSRYGWRPADPPGRPVLFVNPRSGGGKAGRAGAAERARAKGIEAVILTPGQDLAALARGTRPPPGGDQLGIVVVDAPGGSPRSLGRACSAPRIEVSAPEPVHAGVDGEAVDLDPPLRFAIRPASLRVRICPLHPGASPSALLNLTAQPPRAVSPAPEARVESVMQNRLASAGLWGLHERSVQVSGQQPQRVLVTGCCPTPSPPSRPAAAATPTTRLSPAGPCGSNTESR